LLVLGKGLFGIDVFAYNQSIGLVFAVLVAELIGFAGEVTAFWACYAEGYDGGLDIGGES
jgi:hypothetical protein